MNDNIIGIDFMHAHKFNYDVDLVRSKFWNGLIIVAFKGSILLCSMSNTRANPSKVPPTMPTFAQQGLLVSLECQQLLP
jgi:hypothetical protein